ncbi:hypothetical protein EDC96DRAFT_448230 [Choanephora cucurbitarum]|nr:hypothetical protein EDC96DRAFT_448230 [Choanephora cucurbitarum]
MFNHRAIWPILSLAIDDKTSFFPGEIELSASSENYNADALIKYSEVEICVLETSGRYKLEDKARFGYDYVKGAFALLSMIKAIYKKYRFATKETTVELRVHFVHARGTKMHLWSLEAPFENTFVMQRVASTEIPAIASDSSSILSLGNFAWALKQIVSKTSKTLDKMAEEHEAELISVQFGEEKQPEDLYSMVDKEIVNQHLASIL